MTTQRAFKQRVRARMAKTGESYTAARRMLLESGDRPDRDVTEWEPPVSDDAVTKATGADWHTWLSRLDEADMTSHSHRGMVRWLLDHDVEHWWAQTVAVGYERARGLRAPGQQPDGWAVGASRTISVPVERLYEAVIDDDARRGWLPNDGLHERTATRPKRARYDWEDGETRVAFYFDERGPDKSHIALQHERLPDADSAEAMKAWWRERLGDLKTALER